MITDPLPTRLARLGRCLAGVALVLALAPASAQQSDLGALQDMLGGAQALDDDLLPPEQAFAASVRVDSPDRVIVEYQVADGYYLYHDKFAFDSNTPGVELGRALIPLGKIKQDEFFGEVETHRDRVVIDVPIAARQAAAQEVVLSLKSQGCADVGVCYPPFTQKIPVSLPVAAASTEQQAAELGSALGLDGATDEEELLEPDVAFALRLSTDQAGQITLDWDIADGYYLYLKQMAFSLDGDEHRLGEPRFSKTKIKEDEFFGRMAVFYGHANAVVPVLGSTASGDTVLRVRYQGCADIGVCYPPVKKTFNITVAGTGGTGGYADATPGAGAGTALAPMSEQDRMASSLASQSIWLSVLMFFGLGLLLTFTPCVLPMIPILSSIIAGQGADVGPRKAFTLSLVYVLAMAVTYTIAGVLVGLSGENVQALFQNPWVLSSFAALFVLLSLSMFGFYELQMPNAIQSRLTAISNSQRGGTYTGVAIMGFLSALIVGPCVTAPLVGALIYIAQTGDAVLGGAALFALSLGMGVPLLVIGTSAGKLMPKAGPWMDSVKAVFGVLLLGLAIWLLERILPTAATMALWAILLLVSAIYLGALEPLREAASGWMRLWKGAGLVSLVAGVLLLIGAAGGGHSLLQPLKGIVAVGDLPATAGGGAPAHSTLFRQVKGVDGLQRELAAAAAQNRVVMLDFYADWCISCKEMEAFTFSDERVRAALGDALLLQSDVTANDEVDRQLLKHFGLFGPPAILFFDRAGNEQRGYRVVGFMGAEKFSRNVSRAFGAQHTAATQGVSRTGLRN